MFGFLRRRLSELELSKLSREQRKLYAEGGDIPNFRGPLSIEEQASIAGDENIVYQNPTDKYMSDMAGAFKKVFQEREEEFEAAKGAPA